MIKDMAKKKEETIIYLFMLRFCAKSNSSILDYECIFLCKNRQPTLGKQADCFLILFFFTFCNKIFDFIRKFRSKRKLGE